MKLIRAHNLVNGFFQNALMCKLILFLCLKWRSRVQFDMVTKACISVFFLGRFFLFGERNG